MTWQREAEVSRMVCRSLEEVEKPLDMSHCVLRALSPMCHKFLKNMGIRSTMSSEFDLDRQSSSNADLKSDSFNNG